MFVGPKTRAVARFLLRQVAPSRPRVPRLLQLALIGAAGMSLLLALTASARVGVAASAGPVRAESTAVPFPLSVRDAFLRKLGGRFAGTATIVNTGNASVRSTTGVLGLTRGAVANATGVVTFSVPSLPPRGSRKVRFTSGRLHALPLRSGNYKVLICTDIYSQIQRFAWNRNCSLGGEILLSATGLPNASRPVPNTVIGARVRTSVEARPRSSPSRRRLRTVRSSAGSTVLHGSRAPARGATPHSATGDTALTYARSARRAAWTRPRPTRRRPSTRSHRQ